jgi:hypothetical protein
MEIASRRAFLALVLLQAAHSVEEYVFRLYDVFAPARFASSLVSNNLALGFVVLNASFFVFGMWCYFALVRPGRPAAAGFVWGWVIVELANGVGHTLLSVSRRGYFPGVATAPLLFLLAAYLVLRLSTEMRPEGAG